MREQTKGQNFLEGAMILTMATMVVKVVGAVFKIPLANILGGVGMSYFVTAYDLFTPLYSLTVTGLGIAVSRLIAEYSAKGDRIGVESVLRAAKRIFVAIGIVGTMLLWAVAPWFVRAVGNPAALFSVVAIAPTVMFSCISAIYRGYYQGRSNMLPTAISQVIESLVRMGAGIVLAYGVSWWLMDRYGRTGSIMGQTFSDVEQARLFSLRFAAAGAIVGVMLSTVAGAFYIRRHFSKTAPRFSGSVSHTRVLQSGRSLITIAIPIALSTLVVNLSALIDLTSVMNCLGTAIERDSAALLAMYPNAIPSNVTLELLPEYLYGSYSGLAYSIFNLVPAITSALGVSAIPTVARAWSCEDRGELGDSVSSILRMTMLIALPAGLGISTLAQPILATLYPGRMMEVAIVAPILRIMGISAIFVAAATPINSILQAIGREKLPLVILLMGASVKLITNYTLIPRPDINIQGVPYGTLLCYLVVVLLSSCSLRLCAGVKVGFYRVFIKPLLCAVVSSAAAWLAYSRLPLANLPKLAISIAFAAIIYALSVTLSGTICKKDLKMLPISENMLKTLEKLGFIR